MWVVGIWGKSASLADAALPPPYTKEFFAARLREWVMSLQPLIIGPARDHRDRLDDPDGSTRAAPGAYVRPGFDLVAAAVRRHAHRAHGDRRPVLPVHERERGAHGARRARCRSWRSAGACGSTGPSASLACCGVVVISARSGGSSTTACTNRWVSEKNQWANQGVRSSLAAVHEVVADAGDASERARDELQRHRRRDRDQHGVRLGEDVHERVPHRDPRRHGQVPRHVPGDRRELPRRRAHHRRERGVQRRVPEALRRAPDAAERLSRGPRRVPDRPVLQGALQRGHGVLRRRASKSACRRHWRTRSRSAPTRT